ncbi:MAG: cytochrome P450 [Iphinoe sp. HA4291-MV1]|jgi:cytochrome P450|nr:cytochrome P450 [Iphinoe sp. HA4291-MV1]
MTTKEIPVAKGLPLIGNLVPLIQNPYQFFVKTYQKLGPLYRVRVPGRVMTILGGPEANMFVSQKEMIDCLTTYEVYGDLVKELGMSLLVALEGEPHRRCRKITEQFLSPDKIAQYVKPIIQATLDFSKDWQLGQRVELTHLMEKPICTQLALAFLSTIPGDYCEDIITSFSTIVKVIVAKGFQSRQGLNPELHTSKYLTAKKRTLAFIQEIINERRKAIPVTDNPDMLDTLLTITHADGQPLTEYDIFSFMALPLFSALDTSARTVPFLLYEILKNPEIHEQVMAEVNTAFANGIPNIEDIKKMKILRWAVMETLRMYPIGFLVQRYVKHPFDFAEYKVESGQIIYIALGISHFLPEFYPEPHTFDVERYGSLRQEHKQPGAFAPFGFGAHTCAGARLAEVQLMLTVATLLYAVHPQLDPPTYTLKTAFFSKDSPIPLRVKGGFYIKINRKSPLVSQPSLVELRR